MIAAGICGVLALGSVAAARRAGRTAGVESPVVPSMAIAPVPSPSVSRPHPHEVRTAAPAARPARPIEPPIAGKGMWIYRFERVAGGSPARIARLATTAGLTHIFVRVGSGAAGLKTLAQAGSLIPFAHRHGIKVIAWYFPYFKPVEADVKASLQTIRYRVSGQSFDGFAADIEPAPGSLLTASTAWRYSKALHAAAGSTYLVVVPPRPSERMIRTFPYRVTLPFYDAVAPMIYWGRFSPRTLVADSLRFLARFGLPMAPIGQAYDMGPEGGPWGNPSHSQIVQFLSEARRWRSIGVSFWEWTEASIDNWRAIREFGW